MMKLLQSLALPLGYHAVKYKVQIRIYILAHCKTIFSPFLFFSERARFLAARRAATFGRKQSADAR